MSNKKRCCRCRGLKKVFKVNSGYTLKDTGGQEMKCPLCMGSGIMPEMPEITKKEEKQDDSTKGKENTEKDCEKRDNEKNEEKPKKRRRKTDKI